jgi:predicted nucleotidyltransferase
MQMAAKKIELERRVRALRVKGDEVSAIVQYGSAA